MFEIFKKKEPMIISASSAVADFDLAKEIVIHSMPPRYRLSRGSAGDAKKTGLAILIVGGLVLVAAAAGLYYFLFVATPEYSPNQPGSASSTVAETNGSVADQTKVATTTESASAGEAGALASSTPETVSSSSAENIASSTAATSSSGTETRELTPARDQDGDGLSDSEEAILGTNPAAADSDGDGYSDVAELANLYDPAGAGKIIDNQKLKQYINNTYNYRLIYPAAWIQKSLGGDYSISFTSPENQFFQIEVQPNTGRESIIDWYREQFGEPADVSRLIEQKDPGGAAIWSGVKSPDGLSVYLSDAKLSNIYTLSYNVGLENVNPYPGLFNLFIKSFQFGR